MKVKPTYANVTATLALFFALGAGVVFAGGGGGAKPGKVVGYAKVKANAGVVARQSKNIRNSNVALENDAAYCFRNLPFRFKGAQVTIDYGADKDGGGIGSEASFAKGDPYGDCDPGAVDAEVATSDGANYGPRPFYIVFYK
jgi:hypothetical protein